METRSATPVPKKSGRPAGSGKYPRQVVVMVSEETRARIDQVIVETGASLGEVVRALIEDGFRLQGTEYSAAHSD